jgi:hypothetical protein
MANVLLIIEQSLEALEAFQLQSIAKIPILRQVNALFASLVMVMIHNMAIPSVENALHIIVHNSK